MTDAALAHAIIKATKMKKCIIMEDLCRATRASRQNSARSKMNVKKTWLRYFNLRTISANKFQKGSLKLTLLCTYSYTYTTYTRMYVLRVYTESTYSMMHKS